MSNVGGDRNDAPNPVVEKFCNAVAAAALMPGDWLLREHPVANKGNTKTWDDDDELDALARRFGVNPEAGPAPAADVRSHDTNPLRQQTRGLFRNFTTTSKRKKRSGPEYHLAALGQLGRTFTQLVFQGYHDRYFTLRDVAGLLNMKVTTVPVMEKAAFGLAG